jgi:hypothetical protein
VVYARLATPLNASVRQAKAFEEAWKWEASTRACLHLSVRRFGERLSDRIEASRVPGERNAAPLRSSRSGRKRETVSGRVSLSRERTVPTRDVTTPERELVSIKSIEPSVRTASGRAVRKWGFGWTAVELAVGAAVAFPFEKLTVQQ